MVDTFLKFNPSFTYKVVSDRNDLTGVKFDGATEITIYTIPNPKIGDIIIFPYHPNKSEEIFRVKNISTSLNVTILKLKLKSFNELPFKISIGLSSDSIAKY